MVLGVSGSNITTGNNNIVAGQSAGLGIVTQSSNVMLGANAGDILSGAVNIGIGSSTSRYMTGFHNVGLGYETLQGASTSTPNSGSYNIAIGFGAGKSISTGASNFFGGNGAGDSTTTGSNNTVIGNGSDASSATVSNEITLGNSSIATLRCQVTSITALSDARDKTNVAPLQAGLNFVEHLAPVSFDWDMRDGGKVGVADTGFIAQDLQKVQIDTGITIPGLVFDENPDRLEAAYGKLVPVLVQSIKELSAKVTELEAQINS